MGNNKRTIRAGIAALAVGAVALTGCSGGLGGSSSGDGGGGDDEAIRIGYVTPRTGPLALFGEADAYVLDMMEAYFADNPITLADGSTRSVEIISKDTQSDSRRAAEVATELILQDDVDLILVSSTPDTVNPVSDQCEANQVVCISTVAPWQAYYFGRGGTPDEGFDYTYHFFFGMEELQSVYSTIWEATTDADASVGLLFPNDPDGNAWGDTATGFPPFIESIGRDSTDTGRYENGTTDFSAQIAQFKADGVDILTAIPIPPDFTTFWQQSAQQGFQPQTATIGKAMLFPAAAEALGELGHNVSVEVWWHPTSPFSSSLTGQSAAELAADFEEQTGAQWTQPLGFAEALFEVAVAALESAGSLSAEDVAAALDQLKIDTVVGPVDFPGGPMHNVATTPLVGGQWRLQDGGGYELVIVVNPDDPNIPTGGTPEPITW